MANINVENAEDLQSQDTLSFQIEEVEALSSIYGDEWCVIDEAARIFCIKITDDIDHPKLKACLQIILPPDYPSTAPPVYQINAAWLRGLDRMALSNSLEELYVENAGESILYLWVEKVREFLLEKARCKDITEQPEGQIMTAEEGVVEDDDEIADCQALKQNAQNKQFFDNYSCELPSIKHGGTITDRRSTFQSHLAPVVTPGQILDVRNVLVVVSRWYGGIQLGPDRFKHINNSARNVLVQEGYTFSLDEASKAGGKSKKSKSKKIK
ncbi:protein IMPACT isoform X4 [Esox lucius]|uniref:protein IMPACT isoform X4 n=1 Tax=Esox lucius TaxID=8010 RepID=UPI001476B975|nr:protein IMPACT isoform X4 [Esox lucius]